MCDRPHLEWVLFSFDWYCIDFLPVIPSTERRVIWKKLNAFVCLFVCLFVPRSKEHLYNNSEDHIRSLFRWSILLTNQNRAKSFSFKDRKKKRAPSGKVVENRELYKSPRRTSSLACTYNWEKRPRNLIGWYNRPIRNEERFSPLYYWWVTVAVYDKVVENRELYRDVPRENRRFSNIEKTWWKIDFEIDPLES